MRQVIFILFFIFISGCANQYTEPEHEEIPNNHQEIIKDVQFFLEEKYNPSIYGFNISRNNHSRFQSDLIQTLRYRGYSINESESKINSGYVEKKENTFTITIASSLKFVPLEFNFNKINDSNIYWVKIKINSELFTRAYYSDNNNIVPAGHWVIREGKNV